MGSRHWPDLSPDQRGAHLRDGLGAGTHDEYEVAPFAEIVQASMSKEVWTPVFYSWLSMKGHLQGLHDMQRAEIFATRIDDTVYVTIITIWGHPESVAEWSREGYPVEEMLRRVGVEEASIHVTLARDFS